MSKIMYNVTVKLTHDIVDEWQKYMVNKHIPEVMETGCFESYRLNRLLYLDETDGVTFAVQYIAPDLKTLQFYQGNHAPALQKEHIAKYGEKALAFRTIMEIINEA